MIAALVLFGLIARRVQPPPPPTPSPPVPMNPPTFTPSDGPPPTLPNAGSPPVADGSPPFAVSLGPSLQRFEIARVGWRATPQPWGTPAVFWADLRPVRSPDDRRMPGIILAWCEGLQPAQIKRASAEWGDDTVGPVLHVRVDFDGLERPFAGLRLGAE